MKESRMVLPLSDDNSDRRSIPWVNYTLIALNVLVFFVFQGVGTNDRFTFSLSTVPERILRNTNEAILPEVITDPISGNPYINPETGEPLVRPAIPPTPGTPYLTLLTSMFLHGSLIHLLGNMLFLWIFGDNVEDAVGHLRYVGFYLLSGLLASLAHILVTAVTGVGLDVPSLGASGAISGVLGGYILLFPHKRVMVLLFRFLTWVPAWVAIGLWFVFQVLSGLADLGGTGGGVAYGAHVGGFLAGLALIKLFAAGQPSLRDLPPPRPRLSKT
jgi:membrane associated rhomboid family serine protease